MTLHFLFLYFFQKWHPAAFMDDSVMIRAKADCKKALCKGRTGTCLMHCKDYCEDETNWQKYMYFHG